MVFTKIFFVIFGLTLIGSSFGVFQSFHPKINEIYVPTMKTSTFNVRITANLKSQLLEYGYARLARIKQD